MSKRYTNTAAIKAASSWTAFGSRGVCSMTERSTEAAFGNAFRRPIGMGKNCLAEATRIVETADERVGQAELRYRVPGDGVVQNRPFLGYTGGRKPPAFSARLRSWPVREAISLPRSSALRLNGSEAQQVSQCAWPGPVINSRGLLPVRSATRLRMKRQWFRKNCSKSKYEPPRWVLSEFAPASIT
jgi:hypothetical protein